LKTGLNETFYEWIDDIKKAIRHIGELKEELAFYEMKLTGYNAVAYDHVGSAATKNNSEVKLLLVMERIDKIDFKIKKANKTIKEYEEFKEVIGKKKGVLLEYLVETSLSKGEIGKRLRISRSRVYGLVNSIIRVYQGIA